MGGFSKSPPSISMPLTLNGVKQMQKGPFHRISSDQLRRLETGSMDVAEDRAQDHSHL
jgi:hypothetical protein